MSGYAAEPALLDALSDAYVVLLSSSSAQLGATGNAMGAYHLKAEQAVQASGLAWTILRPCSFHSAGVSAMSRRGVTSLPLLRALRTPSDCAPMESSLQPATTTTVNATSRGGK